jgi:hypothetical protein
MLKKPDKAVNELSKCNKFYKKGDNLEHNKKVINIVGETLWNRPDFTDINVIALAKFFVSEAMSALMMVEKNPNLKVTEVLYLQTGDFRAYLLYGPSGIPQNAENEAKGKQIRGKWSELVKDLIQKCVPGVPVHVDLLSNDEEAYLEMLQYANELNAENGSEKLTYYGLTGIDKVAMVNVGSSSTQAGVAQRIDGTWKLIEGSTEGENWVGAAPPSVKNFEANFTRFFNKFIAKSSGCKHFILRNAIGYSFDIMSFLMPWGGEKKQTGISPDISSCFIDQYLIHVNKDNIDNYRVKTGQRDTENAEMIKETLKKILLANPDITFIFVPANHFRKANNDKKTPAGPGLPHKKLEIDAQWSYPLETGGAIIKNWKDAQEVISGESTSSSQDEAVDSM